MNNKTIVTFNYRFVLCMVRENRLLQKQSVSLFGSVPVFPIILPAIVKHNPKLEERGQVWLQ